jgi:hypothetical protein
MKYEQVCKVLDDAGIDYWVNDADKTKYIHVNFDAEYEPTPEQKAFIDAYLTCVANASEEECLAFFEEDAPSDGDAFTDNYGLCTYSSIMDAWCVWQRAKDYARSNT